MAIQPPTGATRRTPSLSQKLRDLGRLRNKSDEKAEREFELVHAPDRPKRLITPVEAPTEDECGSVIAGWQRASAKERLVPPPRSQIREADMDGSAIASDSDDDEDALDRHYGGRFGYGQEVGRGVHYQHAGVYCPQPPKPAPPRWDGAMRKEPGTNQVYIPSFFHGIATASPAPLFSGTAWPPPPTSHPRSPSPAGRGNSVPGPRYTGGEFVHENEEDEKTPVDMEQIVRMEIYRRGRCPFCRKFFHNGPLPLNCPYPDCQKDLRLYLEYPNRREAPKAPPRLAQRAFVDTSSTWQQEDVGRVGQCLTSRPIVPNYQAETATPTKEQQNPLRHHTSQRPSPPSQQRPKSTTFRVEVLAFPEEEQEPRRYPSSQEPPPPLQQRRLSSTFRVEVSAPVEEHQGPAMHYTSQRPFPPPQRKQRPIFPAGTLIPKENQQGPPRHHASRPSSPPLQQRQRAPSPSNTIRTVWPSHLGIYDLEEPNRQTRSSKPANLEKPLPTPPTRSERRPPPSERRPPPTSLQSQPRRITTPRPGSISNRPGLARPGLARPESVSSRRESISAESILNRPRSTTSRPESTSARPRSISTQRNSTSTRPDSFAARHQSISTESISARPGSISAPPEPILGETVSKRSRSVSRRPEPISTRRRSFSTHPESLSARRQSISRPESISAESISNRPKSVTARPWSTSSQSIPSRPGSVSARPGSITTRHHQLYSPQSQPQSQQPKTPYLRTRRNSLSSATPSSQPLLSPVSPTKPSAPPLTAASALRYRSKERGRATTTATDPDKGGGGGGVYLRRRSTDTDRLRETDRSQAMNADKGGMMMDRGRAPNRPGDSRHPSRHPSRNPNPNPNPNAGSDDSLEARLQERIARNKRRRSTHGELLDDADFLAWKGPAGRARYQREKIKAGGDDAELFMDIIGQYESDSESGGVRVEGERERGRERGSRGWV